ncbi:MAG: SRPBCC family protein [Solirubrobacterales bacterium]|nr:SRPBCC family protein [Solirubrobacterales bacterium]
MAIEIADTMRDVVHDIGKTLDGMDGVTDKLSGRKVAMAAAAAAITPLAAKGVGKLADSASGNGVGEKISGVGEKVSGAVTGKVEDAVKGKLEEKVGQAGGPAGIFKKAIKNALPFGGSDDDDDGEDGPRGIGKGRRMPVQQSIDVAVPIETAYNQWTQYEEWPQFMHRVTRVSQEDPATVSFATKIWGKTKEFNAKIVTARPDEKIKWEVTEGLNHTGWVTFHEIAPQLTRVELSIDLEPGGMLEKAARGMRHVKRAARGDLHRFKAYIEAIEQETGAWRGTIEDGKVTRKRESARQSQNGSSGRSRSRSNAAPTSRSSRARGH